MNFGDVVIDIQDIELNDLAQDLGPSIPEAPTIDSENSHLINMDKILLTL